MQLNRIRIGTRLGACFSIMLGLMVVLTVFACVQLASLRSDFSDVVKLDHHLSSVESMKSRSELNLERLAALARVANTPYAATLKSQIDQTRAEVDALDRQLRESAKGVKEIALLDSANVPRQAYRAAREEMLKITDAAGMEAAFTKQVQPKGRDYLAALDALGKHVDDAVIGRTKQVDSELTQTQVVLGTLLCAALVFGALAAFAITRSITLPLRRAVESTRVVAGGDLSRDVSADGDDELAELLRSLQDMQKALRRLVSEVRTTSDSIGTASAEIATGNHDLSSRTEQTASNLQQTAASMEQLNGTVRQSADSARQANQLASSAAQVAARGGSVVSQVVTTMDEINQSSKKISDIIGVIDGIAFQTNILALNAAVEAARAGEQGRGFAVVASEVRSLAQRSAQAAKEIKGLIGASVDRVETGAKLVADAGETMKEIVGSVQRVTDIIGEITAAATEQSEGIGQVNSAVTQLDQMTQQNAALVEESAAAASSLRDQAMKLSQVVSTFRLDASSAAQAVARAPAPAPAPLPKPAPAPAPVAVAKKTPKPIASAGSPAAAAPAKPSGSRKIAPAGDKDGEWESF